MYLMIIEDIFFIYQQVLWLVYEIPVDGTDMPKNVLVVKGRTFRYVCILRIVGFINEFQPKQTEWMISKWNFFHINLSIPLLNLVYFFLDSEVWFVIPRLSLLLSYLHICKVIRLWKLWN